MVVRKYHIRVRTKSGIVQRGYLPADSEGDLRKKLKNHGWVLLEILLDPELSPQKALPPTVADASKAPRCPRPLQTSGKEELLSPGLDLPTWMWMVIIVLLTIILVPVLFIGAFYLYCVITTGKF